MAHPIIRFVAVCPVMVFRSRRMGVRVLRHTDRRRLTQRGVRVMVSMTLFVYVIFQIAIQNKSTVGDQILTRVQCLRRSFSFAFTGERRQA